METKIIKSYSEKTGFEIANGGGNVTYCSWERLKPYLEKAIGLKSDEKIIGIIVDDDGLNIKIDSQK